MTNYDINTLRYRSGVPFQTLSSAKFSSELRRDYMRYAGVFVYWRAPSDSDGVKVSIEQYVSGAWSVIPATVRAGVGTAGSFAINMDRHRLPRRVRFSLESLNAEVSTVSGGLILIETGVVDTALESTNIETIELLGAEA